MSTGHRSSFKVVVDGGELSRELSRGLSRRNVGRRAECVRHRRDKGLRDASSSCSVSPEAPPPDQWLLLVTHRFLDRLPSPIRAADYSGENNNYSVQLQGKTNSAATPQQQRAQQLYHHWSVVTPATLLGTNILCTLNSDHDITH